jgi:hypothetical protein
VETFVQEGITIAMNQFNAAGDAGAGKED